MMMLVCLGWRGIEIVLHLVEEHDEDSSIQCTVFHLHRQEVNTIYCECNKNELHSMTRRTCAGVKGRRCQGEHCCVLSIFR